MSKKKALVLASVYFNSKIKVGSQHYAEALQKEGYDVLYVSFPVTILHYLFFFRNENLKRLFSRCVVVNSILTFIPFSVIPLINFFPFNRLFFLKKWVWFSDLFFKKEIKEFLEKIDVVWIESAYFLDLAEYIKRKNSKVHIYTRMADNVLAFDNFPSSYETLLNRSFEMSDKIVVSAKTLIDKIDINFHNKVHHLPNGINIDVLNKYSVEMPVEYLSDDAKIKIVYIGALEKWFDWEIIWHILVSLSDISVYIIGPINSKPPFTHKNLFLLGPKKHSDIGKYLKNANIGVIPFKRNDLINYVDPIKFYEYSFFNIPTVCTYWDEVATFEETIYLAKDKYQFVEQINHLLSNEDAQNKIKVDFSERNWHANLKKLI